MRHQLTLIATVTSRLGLDGVIGALQPGEDLRAKRRLMNKMVGPVSGGFRSCLPVQEAAVRRLICRLEQKTAPLTEAIEQYALFRQGGSLES